VRVGRTLETPPAATPKPKKRASGWKREEQAGPVPSRLRCVRTWYDARIGQVVRCDEEMRLPGDRYCPAHLIS
jgi:hypothetical protein